MKTKYLFIGILFILFSNSLIAQNNEMEKTINGETYIINEAGNIIKNKKNARPVTNECSSFYIEDISSLDNVIRDFFTQKGMIELIETKSKMSLNIVCNPLGEIEEVTFLLLSKDNPISLEEIYSLEKNIKGLVLKIKSNCPNNKYYSTSFNIFKRLQILKII